MGEIIDAMFGMFWVFPVLWYGVEADVFPFRLAGVEGRSPNFWFSVEADGFSCGCVGMKD